MYKQEAILSNSPDMVGKTDRSGLVSDHLCQ